MTNHIHPLMTPAEGQSTSAVRQTLDRRFVPYINHCYGGTGTLWEGRFKASPVQDESYLLTCYRYIELNPVRAGMLDNPADYPWSSYRTNALGERNPLLSPHPLYLAIGTNDAEHQAAYCDLFATQLDPDTSSWLCALAYRPVPGTDRASPWRQSRLRHPR